MKARRARPLATRGPGALITGYLLFNTHSGYDEQMGFLPRRFINRSSIEMRPPRLSRGPAVNSPTGHKYSVLNPVENFTHTLHELSLRYAMARVPETDERFAEEEEFMRHFGGFHFDGRQRALEAIGTNLSKTQVVELQETETVAVYRSHYVYTIIALSLSVVTSALILALLRDWGRLGRTFSMSPLEIAKAFDAPLLSEAGSNATGREISKQVSDAKVRYGSFPHALPPVTDCKSEREREDGEDSTTVSE